MKVNKLGSVLLSAIALLLLGACSVGGETASVTGTITYLPRIALPPNAVVTVRISDVSIMDVAAPVLGEQTFGTGGKQVPFAFTVPYSMKDIDDSRTYAVSARIEDANGELLFISDTIIPVITRGNPTEGVEILVVQIN